ncbi:hypothetical protein LENED_008304 [Lentinula edodes]|uniref:Uncharacterized protein n=1 Tax=Lentinula edodes TaxID=5353 RepID=A0A1Q3EGT1_LENED|nr:hypothetical protein LENED_008304 [Lentinula edodes]
MGLGCGVLFMSILRSWLNVARRSSALSYHLEHIPSFTELVFGQRSKIWEVLSLTINLSVSHLSSLKSRCHFPPPSARYVFSCVSQNANIEVHIDFTHPFISYRSGLSFKLRKAQFRTRKSPYLNTEL